MKCAECGTDTGSAAQVCAVCSAPASGRPSLLAGWQGALPAAAPSESPGFSTTRLRPGYDIAEVDAFLEAVRDTFHGVRRPPLTADEIRDKKFATTRLRPGYDEEEVDAFLEEAEARLRGRCAACGAETAATGFCGRCGAPVAAQSSAAPALTAALPDSAIGQQIPQTAVAPQQAKSPRRRAWIGFGGGLAVLVVAIAAIVMTRSSPGVHRSSSAVQRSSPAAQVMYQSLLAGNCLRGSDVSLSLTAGSQWPEFVAVVPCTQPHIAEVFFANNIWPQSRKAYPGETAIDNRATVRCAKAFKAYDGIASTASKFDTTFVAPDAATWLPGDRLLVCVAYRYTQSIEAPDGTSPLSYSIKGSRS